jgi:hypothetical protein
LKTKGRFTIIKKVEIMGRKTSPLYISGKMGVQDFEINHCNIVRNNT